jgi:hypothetical protein
MDSLKVIIDEAQRRNWDFSEAIDAESVPVEG